MNLTTTTERFGQDDQSWLASAHGTQSGRTITLDVSTFTAGTHYPNGYLPSGLPLAQISDSGLYGLYDGSAEDGRGDLSGHLFTAVRVPSDGSNPQGALLWHGAVLAAKLPVAVDEAGQAGAAGRITYF